MRRTFLQILSRTIGFCRISFTGLDILACALKHNVPKPGLVLINTYELLYHSYLSRFAQARRLGTMTKKPQNTLSFGRESEISGFYFHICLFIIGPVQLTDTRFAA
jgi:hypothetical protein